MADTIRVVEYFYVETPNTPGVGAAMLTTLRDARVNLLGFSGFPSGRRAQIDCVPEDAAAFRAAAKAAKWKLVGPKKAFLISGGNLWIYSQALAPPFIRQPAAPVTGANDAVFLAPHECLDRQPFLRRGGDDGKVAQAFERHAQCSRNGRGGQRQHVDLGAQRL